MKYLLLLLSFVCMVMPSLSRNIINDDNENIESVLPSDTKVSTNPAIAYVKATIPQKIISCMTDFNLLRCMKMFLLQKMESKREWPNTGNITADFLNNIIAEPNTSGKVNTIDEFYTTMTDKELNERLTASFKKFFRNREIKMHFIPGMVVKLQPSKSSFMDMSLSRELTNVKSTGRQRIKSKHSQYLLQMGIPAVFLPIVMLGSFMPMLLPAIKMAALFAGSINNAALIGALMYLARTAALENEKKNTVYFNTGGL